MPDEEELSCQPPAKYIQEGLHSTQLLTVGTPEEGYTIEEGRFVPAVEALSALLLQ